MKLPIDGRWHQPNNSDKFGSLWATKNINLDEEGYLKLSPRSVKLIDQATNGDFGIPHAIGQYSEGDFQVATTSDANFNVSITDATLTATENSGSNEPELTPDSHAIFWIDRWHASDADEVWSKAANGASSGGWTQRITSLTSGVRHYMEVFASRNQLCVTNGNVVKQYNTSYTGTTDLTIPSDFETVGLAYNNGKMGVITRGGVNATGQILEAKFYIWDGSTTSATGYGVGSDACISIVPYKSSFVVLTRAGELKYFNGGGFETLATFPFYYLDKWWAGSGNFTVFGNNMVVDGDVIYINVGFQLRTFGRKEYQQLPNLPSGVWCFDPRIGLYHKWSPSGSQLYLVTVAAGGTNTTTNVLTAASGTLPATGNPVRYIRTSGTGITGLTVNQDYYIIKVTSSTFKLASTKALALAGTEIDLTAADSDNSYFHMYELVDYGNSFHENAGAISLFGRTTEMYQDIIFGGDYATTALATNQTLCMVVPFLENRGWFITPRIYSQNALDTTRSLFIKFRPLKTDDAIVVKVKSRELDGLPISSPNIASSDEASWTSDDEFSTTSDLSAAKSYLDDGGELEIEFVAGAGAGQTVVISEINLSGSTYTLVLAESVLGAAASLKSHFIIDNWTTLATITAENPDHCYREIPIGTSQAFVQLKIELRGVDTTIEELHINQVPRKP